MGGGVGLGAVHSWEGVSAARSLSTGRRAAPQDSAPRGRPQASRESAGARVEANPALSFSFPGRIVITGTSASASRLGTLRTAPRASPESSPPAPPPSVQPAIIWERGGERSTSASSCSPRGARPGKPGAPRLHL